MSKSNFDKNGVDKSGTHWLQYAAFVATSFAIYFGWAFFNDDSFHNFAVKNLNFVIVMEIFRETMNNIK